MYLARETPPVQNPTKSRQSKTGRVWKSRAVLREVQAGSETYCTHCGERVKFQAKMKNLEVICNVYRKGVWARVEHFHSDCYTNAKQPHGVPEPPLDRRSGSQPKQPAPAA